MKIRITEQHELGFMYKTICNPFFIWVKLGRFRFE